MTHDARRRPDDHVIVLFGATGDLARRKLLPGLFNLHCAGLMPEHYRVIGVGRPGSALSDEEFRQRAHDAVQERGMRKPEGPDWDAFVGNLSFAPADVGDPDALVAAVGEAEREIGGSPRRLYHLAIPPAAFPGVVKMLGDSKLDERARVIVEKPFGTDLASAAGAQRCSPRRVRRVSTSSGSTTSSARSRSRTSSRSASRTASSSRSGTATTSTTCRSTCRRRLTIAGRAGFYEQTGAFRDMIVTHLFQVLGFVAMEPPTSLTPKALRDETAKVFDSMKPLDPDQVVRGQYDGYRSEDGVDPKSKTETFVALEVEIDNWRWAGVPFFLRTGKSLAQSAR